MGRQEKQWLWKIWWENDFFQSFFKVKFDCRIFTGRGGGDAPARKKFEDAGGAKTTEKMLIDSKLCGKIVGPGGSVIQELQAEYSVKINIDREPNDVSRFLCVLKVFVVQRFWSPQDGTKNVEVVGSESAVKAAVDAIKQKIGGGRAPRQNDDDEDDSDKYKETLSVEGQKCGRIVGAGGAVIQELQAEYEVKINIDREPDDVSYIDLLE